MSNSQCLPCYTNTFLKDNYCQPIGNGGQIFTDFRSKQEVIYKENKNYKNNWNSRQHLINSATKQIDSNKCSSIKKTRCHYIDIPDIPPQCN